MDIFEYALEQNLLGLHKELNGGVYLHGSYRIFTVCDNKKRVISVAPIRDRVVHRLIYNYLVPIYDKTFIFDAWSCRVGKGLLGAIERAQKFLSVHPDSYVWRADIKKFFDSVDHGTLIQLLARRIYDPKALWLLQEIISSFAIAQRERESLYRHAYWQPHQPDFCQYLPERAGPFCEA